MLEARRALLDQIRAGPALFAGLPGDEVDFDRLIAHLAARRFQGGIYATDGALEGVLWVADGATGEAWFFEESGPEAILPATAGRDLLAEIARRGGLVSVFLRPPPEAGGAPESAAAPVPLVRAAPPAEVLPRPLSEAAAVPVAEITDVPTTPEALAAALAEAVAAVSQEQGEPSARPWPAILLEVERRLARQRGAKLSAMFAQALGRALAARGGAADGERIAAPALPEAAWRTIVEEASAPVVVVAGRAFVDRLIAAAERAVEDAERGRA
ncbi:MAG: hypothetical protein QN174_13865 [Armatimonadota bacterium]|nr:hypothetical protein [Armatimonadota bacterium]MDR7498029.1 hypothetical protein [Armatimonadota bacterium]